MATQNLWPDDLTGDTNFVMPIAIFREQAGLLNQQTKGLVEAFVASSGDAKGAFEHAFILTAPAIENFEYTLFTCIHPVEGYPVKFEFEADSGKKAHPEVKNQEGLMNVLKLIFRSERTKKVIQSLIAQSQSFNHGR